MFGPKLHLQQSLVLKLAFVASDQALRVRAATDTVDSANYADFVPDPDAFGAVPIPGPRLDRSYPGTWGDGSDAADEPIHYPPDQGWILDLRVKQHVRVSDLSDG